MGRERVLSSCFLTVCEGLSIAISLKQQVLLPVISFSDLDTQAGGKFFDPPH
jgi:hypothetical protein